MPIIKITQDQNYFIVKTTEVPAEPLKKQPNRPVWNATIKRLRERGFRVSPNEVLERYNKTMSDACRVGTNKDVMCILFVTSNSITVEFGSPINFRQDINPYFVPKHDNRYLSGINAERITKEIELFKTFIEKLKDGLD